MSPSLSVEPRLVPALCQHTVWPGEAATRVIGWRGFSSWIGGRGGLSSRHFLRCERKCWCPGESLMRSESCLFLYVPFFYSNQVPKSFCSFISVTCSLTLNQSGVRAMEDEGKWGMERREGKWEKFWRPNSHKKQPSNGYCCRKGRNIKYKTETAASIYGADYRRINQSGYLARAAATRQKPRDLQQSHAALWAASDPHSVQCNDIQDTHGGTFSKPQKILLTEPMWCTGSQILSLLLFSATVCLKDAVTVTVFLFLVEFN